jgi:hypothetical protein
MSPITVAKGRKVLNVEQVIFNKRSKSIPVSPVHMVIYNKKNEVSKKGKKKKSKIFQP